MPNKSVRGVIHSDIPSPVKIEHCRFFTAELLATNRHPERYLLFFEQEDVYKQLVPEIEDSPHMLMEMQEEIAFLVSNEMRMPIMLITEFDRNFLIRAYKEFHLNT
ncbi:hypothetical protein TetV_467 [Tetraselmis virus 1]|uniref:Uncharacterized protein n=1 Tax=Tetraselmis virus 1 TaxID=2060617 RepID=A0A2P0VP53_9VIRU|nr:hypothetical protein QJ968_gp587 [Tetraselmis virus 1]AUF82549.1 hypothetical protein TetV_467 [Tetraselmis virus 1]